MGDNSKLTTTHSNVSKRTVNIDIIFRYLLAYYKYGHGLNQTKIELVDIKNRQSVS